MLLIKENCLRKQDRTFFLNKQLSHFKNVEICLSSNEWNQNKNTDGSRKTENEGATLIFESCLVNMILPLLFTIEIKISYTKRFQLYLSLISRTFFIGLQERKWIKVSEHIDALKKFFLMNFFWLYILFYFFSKHIVSRFFRESNLS